jgi:hypothetical protein
MKSTEISDYFHSQDDGCATGMKSTPLGEIMGRVHIADQSYKPPATKGIEAWKDHRDDKYQGYNPVPKIALSVNGLSASQLMIISRDGALQLLSVSPA